MYKHAKDLRYPPVKNYLLFWFVRGIDLVFCVVFCLLNCCESVKGWDYTQFQAASNIVFFHVATFFLQLQNCNKERKTMREFSFCRWWIIFCRLMENMCELRKLFSIFDRCYSSQQKKCFFSIRMKKNSNLHNYLRFCGVENASEKATNLRIPIANVCDIFALQMTF